jgi:hypothetical protein
MTKLNRSIQSQKFLNTLRQSGNCPIEPVVICNYINQNFEVIDNDL